MCVTLRYYGLLPQTCSFSSFPTPSTSSFASTMSVCINKKTYVAYMKSNENLQNILHLWLPFPVHTCPIPLAPMPPSHPFPSQPNLQHHPSVPHHSHLPCVFSHPFQQSLPLFAISVSIWFKIRYKLIED